MKRNNITGILLMSTLIFINTTLVGGQQSSLTGVLDQIKKNNLEIKAQEQWLEKQKVALKTGINPDNPAIEYGYFPGNSEAIGVKETFSASQAFEFPLVYSTRYKMADQRIRLAEEMVRESTQKVLLDAQMNYFELVYLVKTQHEVTKRYHHAASLLHSYQAKFDQGQVSILDLNKARIQELSQEKEHILIKQKIQNTLDNIRMLNGDKAINLTDTTYAQLSPVLRDSLEPVLMARHPRMIQAQMENQLAILETRHARQSWLPELEAGYESEAVNEEVFRGIKAGISIPLWRDKNKVSAAKINESFTQAMISAEKNRLLAEKNNQLDQLETLEETLSQYEKTLKEVNNIALLDKALDLGEISVVDYFTELAFYYDIVDEFLALEYEYYKLLADYRSFLLD